MSSNKAKLAFIKALGKATGDEQRISHDLAVLGVEALQKEALEARFEENEVRDLMPKDQGFDKFKAILQDSKALLAFQCLAGLR